MNNLIEFLKLLLEYFSPSYSISVYLLILVYFIYERLASHIVGDSEYSKNSRLSLALWLRNKKFVNVYSVLIHKVNGSLNGFYGSKLSIRAFDRCLLISLLYPIILMYFSYLMSGEYHFNGLVLFEQSSSVWIRWWPFIVLVLLVSITYFLIKARSFFSDFLKLGLFVCILILLFFFIVLGIVGGEVGRVFLIDVWGSENFGLLVVVATFMFFLALRFFDFKGIYVVALLASFVIVDASDIFGGKPGLGKVDLAGIFFLLIFPVVNALFDFFSLYVTRSMMEYLENHHENVFNIILLLFIDLVIALFLFFLLMIVLGGLFEIFDINWSEYVYSLLDDPFGRGLLITGMLVTTMIPTLFNFSLLMFVLTVRLFTNQEKIANKLSDDSINNSIEHELLAARITLHYLFSMMVIYVIAYFTFLAIYELNVFCESFRFGQWINAFFSDSNSYPVDVCPIIP